MAWLRLGTRARNASKAIERMKSSEDISPASTTGGHQSGLAVRWLQIAAAEGRYEEENLHVRKDKSVLWASVLITALCSSGRQLGFAKIVP